jgi:predicted nucleotidyltransferase component of viral defense system
MTFNPSQHQTILVQILKDIFSDTAISPFLGFKGGTAVRLFYELDRFSVDLDFDLIDESREDSVFEEIKRILPAYGSLKESVKKRYGLFFMLSYEDQARNVKVEINRRPFGSRFEIKSYLGIPMQVMVQEDMAAHKLVAMVERIGKTNRDIYDTWHFLEKNWPINKVIVEARTGMSFKNFLQKCISLLEKMGDRHILAGMGELLDEKQKVWVKTRLRAETLFQLKLRLEGE